MTCQKEEAEIATILEMEWGRGDKQNASAVLYTVAQENRALVTTMRHDDQPCACLARTAGTAFAADRVRVGVARQPLVLLDIGSHGGKGPPQLVQIRHRVSVS